MMEKFVAKDEVADHFTPLLKFTPDLSRVKLVHNWVESVAIDGYPKLHCWHLFPEIYISLGIVGRREIYLCVLTNTYKYRETQGERDIKYCRAEGYDTVSRSFTRPSPSPTMPIYRPKTTTTVGTLVKRTDKNVKG